MRQVWNNVWILLSPSVPRFGSTLNDVEMFLIGHLKGMRSVGGAGNSFSFRIDVFGSYIRKRRAGMPSALLLTPSKLDEAVD